MPASEQVTLDLFAPPAERRIFLGWNAPALPAAVALLAERYARAGVLDLQRALLVLPGRRAMRRLQELLLAEAERRSLRLLPPRLITIGSLPELLYLPQLPAAPAPVSLRAWARALQALPAEKLARLLRLPPPADDLRGWLRLAATVQELHQQVSGAGKRFREVIACCDEQMIFRDHLRWEVLAEAQEQWEAELRRWGYSDGGLARLAAARQGGLTLDADLWLLGVAEMPQVTRRMLLALPADVPFSVLVHAPRDAAALFDELGCVLPAAWAERELPLADEQIRVVEGARQQALAALGALHQLGGGYAADEIVVAVADSELTPYLEQTLEGAGVPVRSAQATPLPRTPLLRLLAALADYLEGRRFDAFAALVRHPDLSRWIDRQRFARSGEPLADVPADWLRSLDEYFSAHLPATTQWIDPDPERRVARATAALVAALHERLLGTLDGERPLRQWMPLLLDLAGRVYGERPLDRSTPEERVLAEALLALREKALGLLELPPELDPPCDAATALRLLLDELQGSEIAPLSERTAVELLGWLEIHLDDTPVAVLTGVNEPFLPESRNAHAYLPNALRSRLGIPDNALRYARDAYQLEAILRSRPVVRVIAGRRSASGDPLRPSRLLFTPRGRALAERVQRFYGAADPPQAAASPTASRRSAFRLPPEPVLSAPQPLTSLRVTHFKLLLDTPYQFALEAICRLEALDDAEREMDPLVFGTFAHDVLERFGRSAEAASSDPDEVKAALRRELDLRAREVFGPHPLPAVRIQVEQLRARLDAFALWQAGWIAAGWRTVAVECTTPPEGAPFEVDGADFGLRGRVDRVDYHAGERRWAVFDYKTGDRGETPVDTHCKEPGKPWRDLQLPLYRQMLPHLLSGDGSRVCDAGPTDVSLGYLRLPRDLAKTGAAFGGWSEEELETALEAARGVIRLVRANRFEFDPARLSAFADSDFAALVGVGNLAAALVEEELEEPE